MKVLIVSTSDYKGGAAKCAYRLAQSLIEDGNDVILYVSKKTRDEKWIVESTMNKYLKQLLHLMDRFPGVLLSFNKRVPFTLGLFGENLDRVINDFKPDIINFHWTGKGFVSFKEIVRLSKLHKCIWTLHDWNYFSDGSFFKIEGVNILDKFPGKLLSSWNLSRKNRIAAGQTFNIVSPSAFLAKKAKESEILSKSSISIINNGIDLEVFKKRDIDVIRRKLGLSNSKKYLLIGAADMKNDSAKGFDLLIASLLGIKGWLEKNNIGIIGFGTTNPFLDSRLAELKLEKVFLGYIENESKMSEVFACSNLLVFPSRIENYPFTVLESLASGTPVIAFSVGGIPEILDSNSSFGKVVNAFDPDEMGQGICNILETKSHVSEIFTKRYSIEKCSDKYMELFSSI